LAVLPFVPESPFRAIARGKVDRARQSIRRLYGSSEDVETKVAEIETILANEQAAAKQAGSFRDCFNRQNRLRTIIVLSVFFTQNMSGIGWVVGKSPEVESPVNRILTLTQGYMGYFMQLSGMEGQSVFDATVGVAGVMVCQHMDSASAQDERLATDTD
jgi:hypothetical protein